MTESSKTVQTAYILAFLTAALSLLLAFWTGPAVLGLFAVIPTIAGVGIVRRRVWSAYGYSLFLCAQLLLVPLVLFRSSSVRDSHPVQILASAAFQLVLVVLFFRAGRSLQAAGAKRGHTLPWIAISILVLVPFIFLEPFVLPSTSMANTLLIGDRFLVQRLPKQNPARGDIFAFHYPLNPREIYVKRVIGIPGDRIRLSNKIVYRNGTPLQEPYAIHESSLIDTYRDSFPGAPNIQLPPAAQSMLQQNVVDGEVVVPEGRYFVLGDNRDDSSDSRYWGFVATGDMIGKPLMIYDSREQTPQNASTTPTGNSKVRWNRLFKVL